MEFLKSSWLGAVVVISAVGLVAGCAADEQDNDDVVEADTQEVVASKAARCVVESNGEKAWSGDCAFAADRNGSFTIKPSRGAFPGGISDISVTILRPGVADVRGLTSKGINSRWGEARRSKTDRACWAGSDFSVCAY